MQEDTLSETRVVIRFVTLNFPTLFAFMRCSPTVCFSNCPEIDGPAQNTCLSEYCLSVQAGSGSG